MTRKSAPKPVASDVVYMCPMHPAVTSATPGECPICRMALERQAAGAAGKEGGAAAEPPSLTLPRGIRLAGFDSVSRVKQFESSFDMRAWAWAESRDVGVALYPRRPGRDAQARRGRSVRARERSARPQPARDQGPLRRAGARALGCRHGAGAVSPRRPRGRRAPAEGDRLGQVRGPIAQRPGREGVGDHSIARRTVRPDRVGGPADVHEAAGPDRQHALRVRRRRGGARENEYAVALHTFVLDAERRLGARRAP